MTIKEIKRKHKLSNKDLACFFDLSYESFTNSSAKQRYLTALERFYNSINNKKMINYETTNARTF